MNKNYIDKIIFQPRPVPVRYVGTEDPHYSLAYYRGKKRVVIGWFVEMETAERYYDYYTSKYPELRFDILPTLL